MMCQKGRKKTGEETGVRLTHIRRSTDTHSLAHKHLSTVINGCYITNFDLVECRSIKKIFHDDPLKCREWHCLQVVCIYKYVA